MKTYQILINKQYAITYEVEANSPEEARKLYDSGNLSSACLVREEFLDSTICDIEEIV